MARMMEKEFRGGVAPHKKGYRDFTTLTAVVRMMTALAVATVVSVGLFATPAVANPLEDMWNGIVSFFSGDARAAGDQDSRISDGDTTNEYKQAGEDTVDNNSTATSGRVWTDKSVFTEDKTFSGNVSGGQGETVEIGDADFLVSYSALSSSTRISGQTKTPVDVVLVVDLSGSMSNANSAMPNDSQTSRIAATVDAANATIEKLMESNENNRVAVVGFNNGATVLMPLNHYSKSGNQNYLTLDRRSPANGGTTIRANAVATAGDSISANARVSGGTNTQYGMYTGMNLLANSDSTTVEINGTTVNRVPSVILLSDGMSSVQSSSSEWWEPVGKIADGQGFNAAYEIGSGSAKGEYPGNAFTAMLTSAYMKQQIDGHYGASSDSAYATTVYTIGMGVESMTGEYGYAKLVSQVTLDPGAYLNANNNAAKVIKSYWDSYIGGGEPEVNIGRDTGNNQNESYNWKVTHPEKDDVTSINYVDKYYSAEDADDITNVFDQILSDISVSTPTYPTQIQPGEDALSSGYLTYTDPIGEYMEVDELKEIIYNDQIFEKVKETPIDGGTRYEFEGELQSPVDGKTYPVSNITIETASDKSGNQELIVKIPAALIPMRINDIELNADGTVKSNTPSNVYPMRILYTVSFKDEVLLKDQAGNVLTDEKGKSRIDLSKVSNEYVAAHSEKDENGNPTGNVWFYSNQYNGKTPTASKQTAGDAYVEFTPAATNPFYFIQEDTPLYNADGTPVTDFKLDGTYKFETSYYEGTSIKTYEIERAGSQLAEETSPGIFEGVVQHEGKWYIAAGTPRLANLMALAENKGGQEANNTETADLAYYPTFQGDTIETGHFQVFLGNNGRVTVEQPGELTVTKAAQVGAGFTGPSNLDELSFNFTLSLKDGNNSVTEKHRAQVYKGANKVGDELWLADGDTFLLKNGETLHVYNLSAGITYTVAENENGMPAGFRKTSATGETGEIEAGQTAAAAFTNTYTATSTTVDGDNFRYQKDFGNYWDNNPGISFEFRLEATGNTAVGNIQNPLPGNDIKTDEEGHRYVKVDVADGNVGSFGGITFEKPGTYSYTISEHTPSSEALGVDYSNELYTVAVKVEDNGAGKLVVNGVAMTKTNDWNGDKIEPAATVADHIAVIENRFDLLADEEGPLGDKVYVDSKGGTSLKDGAFKFYVDPVQIYDNNGAVVPNTTDADFPMSSLKKDDSDNYYTTNAANGSIAFGAARFAEDNVGYTYVYKVWEQTPTPAVTNMDYDDNVYYVHVKVIKTQKDGEDAVDAQFSWRTSADFDAALVQGLTGNRIKFTNTYAPADAELTLVGQKTLDGRAWGENETFGFTLTPTSNDEAYHAADGTVVSTAKAVEDGVVSIAAHADGSDGDAAAATKPVQGATAEFSFGDMTFAHAGTYKFTVNENRGSLGGLEYDKHSATVTVVVAENGNGQLVATPTYSNAGAPNASDVAITDKAAFTNYYTTSRSYAGVTFRKVMNGRDLRAQEFSFSISGHADSDANDHPVNVTINNQHNHPEGYACDIKALSGLVFTQADAGKTFTYVIDEIGHKDDGTGDLSGVTYDTRTFMVTLSVSIDVAADGASNLVVSPMWTSSDGSAITDGVPKFSNSYTPGNVTADASAKFKKELTGRDWHDGETYQFKLTPENGAPLPDAGQDGITINADNTATVTVDKAKKDGWGFGNITFTAANMNGATLNNGVKQKVFTYKVNEVVSSEDASNAANEGMTYSDEELTLRIVVTDNGNGVLAAQVTTPNGNTFTNEYATSVDYALDIAKTLTGHAQAEDQFKFYVRAADEATARKLGFVNEDGQVDLSNRQITQKMPGAADGVEAVVEWLKSGDVTFTNEDAKNGKTTYTFYVGESLPNGVNADNQTKDGYTYETSERTVTIEVEDDTNGTLTVTTKVDGDAVATYTNKAAITTVGKVAFNNSYAASGSLNLKGDKSIVASASEWTGDESGFEFKIEQVDADKNVVETDPSVTLPSDRIVSADDGAFAINGITFTKVGTYHFKVSEVTTGIDKVPGIQYDAAPIYLDVTVSENDGGNGNGKLDVSVTIDGKSFDATNETLSFVNTYTTTPDTFTPEVTKYVAGLDAVEHFTFELSTSDETTQKAIDNNVITGSGLTKANGYKVERHTGEGDEVFIADGKSKTVSFNEMTFTKAGTYIFHVNEANNAPNKSWTYDDHTYTLKIVVTDKESKLDAVATKEGIDQEEQSSEFTNKFGTSTTYSEQGGLQVTKTLNGRALEAGKFNFVITTTDTDSQAKLDALGDKKAENTSFSNGAALMGEPAVMEKLGGLAFTEADIDKTFIYTVAEVKPGDAATSMPGYSYDENLTAEVKIEVKQTDGKIYTVTTVTKGGKSDVYDSKDGAKPAVAPFVNSYAATGELDGSANLAGTKTLIDDEGNVVPLNGRAWDFTLSAFDDEAQKAIDNGIVTLPKDVKVQNNANGTFNFGNITFKSTGADSVTYKFKVTESGELKGVENDPDKERLVEVRVTDNGNGTLTAEVVGETDLAFINQYGADATAQVEVKGTKTLALAEGVDNAPSIKGEFSFTLAANNAPLNAGDSYNVSPTNPNECDTGTVTFGNLKFTMADLAGVEYGADGTRSKEFTYTVTESGSVPGVQNGAGNPNTVKIKLTDDGEGNLEAELLNEFAFTNTYAPAAVTNAPVDVKKVLEGRTPGLQANEFTFEMKVVAHKGSPADGFKLPGDTTAKNDTDGNVTFGDITFTKPGTYTVSVKEVVPADKDKAPFMTYDGHVYSYDVVVFSNGSDKLQVRTENESGSKTFTNTYEAPEDTKDVTKTEDPKTTINGQLVGVGDKLTYKINWVNDAVDAQGKATAATVTITDTVPAGTTLVENGIHDGGAQGADGVITWTIDAAPSETGTVSFDVVVADTALSPVDKITNEATITIGGNDSKVTVDNDFPKKIVEAPEGGVKVGDELTYAIQWANTSKDAAEVVVSDKLSDGLTFVEASKPGKLDKKTDTVTWNLGEQQAGTSGEVTVKVRVNEKALTVNTDNQATIKVGNNSEVTTNAVPGPKPQSGNLTISKTVVVPEGLGLDVDKASQRDFTFTVELTDAKGKALTGEYAYTGANDAKDGKLKSGDKITLKHGQSITIAGLPEGTKYTVTEAALDGFTPTPEDGVLKGTVSTDVATAAFTNTYGVQETKLEGAKNLEVTKAISGRKWAEGDSFDFELTANMDDPATKAAVDARNITLPGNAAKITINNDSKDRKTAFGDITFKQAGDFQFYITELGESHDGLTYSTKPQLVKVRVTDNGDGSLTATVTEGKSPTITNTYDVTGSGELTLGGTKTIKNRAFDADDSFAFTVTGTSYTESIPAPLPKGDNVTTDGNTATVTIDPEAGKNEAAINYGTIAFDKSQLGATFTYTVSEVHGGDTIDGLSYDKTVYTVTVKVVDNGKGGVKLNVLNMTKTPEAPATRAANQVTKEQVNNLDFINTYDSVMPNDESVKTDVTFTKVLDGRDWLDTDAFDFTLTAKTPDAPMPVDADGNPVSTVKVTKDNAKGFSFGQIAFTYDMVKAEPNKTKTFEYEVTEVKPEQGAIPNVDYTKATATVSITVKDDGNGKLVATVTKTGATFTNTYTSNLDYGVMGGLSITKVLDGRDMLDKQFGFTVTAQDGVKTSAADTAKLLGITKGASATYDAPAAKNGETALVASLGSQIKFTQDDAGKTYRFTVEETKVGGKGYTNDTAVRTVQIAVADNGDGTLTATTTVSGKGEPQVFTYTTGQEPAAAATVPFANSYATTPAYLGGEGNARLNATKTLTGRDMAADEFGFAVVNTADGPDGSPVATGSNAAAADGAAAPVTFTPIEYTSAGLYADASAGKATAAAGKDGKVTYTYEYAVNEVSGLVDGVTGVTTAFSVRVNVTDNNDGTLGIEVVYPEGSGDTLAFANAYGLTAKADVTVSGQKRLTTPAGTGYTAPDITGKYTFTLEGSEGSPMPEATETVNDAAGNVDFGKITYTMENAFGDSGEVADAENGATGANAEATPAKSAPREKTFTYTVKESGNVAGVTNDAEAVKTFTVKVVDNGDGTITATPSTSGLAFSFVNAYAPQPAEVAIDQARKTLTGRDLRDGEFSFDLKDASGAVVKTVQNNAEGVVDLGTLTFTAPGTYRYTVSEQAPQGGVQDGVTYDGTVYDLVVTVTDAGDGALKASASYELKGLAVEQMAFANSYRVTPNSISFRAAKILTGRDLRDGEFSFELREGGRVLQTVKNATDGSISFDAIEFAEPGEHDYELVEVKGDAKGITYDKTVFTYHVSVTDNGDGTLKVTWTEGEAGDPVFRNSYQATPTPPVEEPEEPKPEAPKTEEPKKPEQQLPRTGDSMPSPMALGAMAAAGVGLIGCSAALIKRNRQK